MTIYFKIKFLEYFYIIKRAAYTVKRIMTIPD